MYKFSDKMSSPRPTKTMVVQSGRVFSTDQRKQWWYRVAGYSAVAPSELCGVMQVYKPSVLDSHAGRMRDQPILSAC